MDGFGAARHIAQIVVVIVASGCAVGSDGEDSAGDPGGPDYESVCTEWVPDDCSGGCSTESDELWASGYMAYLSERWGFSDELIGEHARVRSVDVWGKPSRYAAVWLQLESSWLVSLIEVQADLPSEPSSIEETKAAFESGLYPQVDLESSPRTWSDVSASVDACESELGVEFGEQGWCSTYVTMDPGDDDQAGVRYTHYNRKDLGKDESAYATVYAWGGDETDRCGVKHPVE